MAILIIVINHQQQKIKSTEGEQLTRRKLLQNNLCEVVESRSHKCEGKGERETVNCLVTNLLLLLLPHSLSKLT